MRVLPAAQLISASMAKAIRYLYEMKGLLNKTAPLAAEVIGTVNSWFDILNSREGRQDTNLKGPFGGAQFNLQREIIEKMSYYMENMRFGNRQAKLPFQHGVLLTNRSLLQLQRYKLNLRVYLQTN
jgi:hypothetical protein